MFKHHRTNADDIAVDPTNLLLFERTHCARHLLPEQRLQMSLLATSLDDLLGLNLREQAEALAWFTRPESSDKSPFTVHAVALSLGIDVDAIRRTALRIINRRGVMQRKHKRHNIVR